MEQSFDEKVAEQFDNTDGNLIYFFDEEGDYVEQVDSWDRDGIDCIRAEGSPFNVKYQIETSDRPGEERTLLYFNGAFPDDWSEVPIAYLLAAADPLQIDPVAEFLDAFDLSFDKRSIVEPYYKGDLEYKNRCEFLSPLLRDGAFDKHQLAYGLLMYHARDAFDDVHFTRYPDRPELVLAAMLVGMRSAEEFESFRESIQKRGLEEAACRLLDSLLEVDADAIDRSRLIKAAANLKYTLLMEPIEPEWDPFDGRYWIDDEQTRNHVYEIVAYWRDNEKALGASVERVLDDILAESDVDIEQRLIDRFGVDAEYGFLTPTLKQRRLEKAVERVKDEPDIAGEMAQSLQARAEMTDATALVGALSDFYRLYNDFDGIHSGDVTAFVDTYSEKLFYLDRYYRKARGLGEAVDVGVADDALHQLESDYSSFVRDLNDSWQKRLESWSRNDETNAFRRQADFYEQYPGREDVKTAVIICDGLRYEAGDELRSRLSKDTKKLTQLDPSLAPLPSTTKMGMAHLLPHETVSMDDGGSVSVDGQWSSGIKNRRTLLQAEASDSNAIHFDDVYSMSSSEARAYFKENRLVYIYQNQIDSIGDDRDTERQTWEAVEKTIDDVEEITNKLLSSWNVSRVFITADHGFLYSEEVGDSKLEPTLDAEGIEDHVRYAVFDDEDGSADPSYRIDASKLTDLDRTISVEVPHAVNRFRRRGSGKRYVHGGASLQELVVPVLSVQKRDEEVAEKVDIEIISENRIVRAKDLQATLLQKQPISKRRRARSVVARVETPKGDSISSTKTFEFDFTAEQATERTEKVVLGLDPSSSKLDACYLAIYDDTASNRFKDPILREKYEIQRLMDPDF